MAGKIVLISDDKDYFEYIKAKLELRKSDELYVFSFDEIPDKINFLESGVLIVNSENSQEKTLDLLKIFSNTPIIITAFNEDEKFKKKCYREGMFDYMPVLISDSEFRARIMPALTTASLIDKNKQYRDLLVNNNLLKSNSEVFLNFDSVIDNRLEYIKNNSVKCIFGAVSPDEKDKFLISSNAMETIILNNLRINDMLLNYAPNKYFLLLFDTDLKSVNKWWGNISEKFHNNVYSGFVKVTNQTRQQLINAALNELHTNIMSNKGRSVSDKISINEFKRSNSPYDNFKQYRTEFCKKIEQTIVPVFYRFEQKFSSKLPEYKIEQNTGAGFGTLFVKGKKLSASFRVTCPGFSAINIDITLQKNSDNVDTKRITINPEELESGVIEDLLTQFISEIRAL